MNNSKYQYPIEWSAIFAGSAVAIATTLILSQFGSIIGLSSDGVLAGKVTLANWAVIATGIWLLWVQLFASVTGGYIAGRMRSMTSDSTAHENELRDGVYGLTTWAISSLAVFAVVGLAAAFGVLIDSINGNLDVPTELSNKEQNMAIIYAFILGSTSLVSAVASWWAATVGGDHRDQKTDFTKVISFK
jgi:hypothetical protein